jgi:hypothetical protein
MGWSTDSPDRVVILSRRTPPPPAAPVRPNLIDREGVDLNSTDSHPACAGLFETTAVFETEGEPR